MGTQRHALPAAPAYSQGLEFTLALLLRGMDPEHKLMLARRMGEVFSHLEQEALRELGGADRNRGD
jgi:hypothetical protein